MRKLLSLLMCVCLLGAMFVGIGLAKAKDSVIAKSVTFATIEKAQKGDLKDTSSKVIFDGIEVDDCSIRTSGHVQYKGSQTTFSLAGTLKKGYQKTDEIIANLTDKTGNFDVIFFSIDASPEDQMVVLDKNLTRVLLNEQQPLMLLILREKSTGYLTVMEIDASKVLPNAHTLLESAQALDEASYLDVAWWGKCFVPTEAKSQPEANDKMEIKAGSSYNKWDSVCYFYDTYGGEIMELDTLKISYREPGDNPGSSFIVYCYLYIDSKVTKNIDTGVTTDGSHICLKPVSVEIITDTYQEVCEGDSDGSVFQASTVKVRAWDSIVNAAQIVWPSLSFADVLDLDYSGSTTVDLNKNVDSFDANSRKGKLELPSSYMLYQEGNNFKAIWTINNNGAGNKELLINLAYTSDLYGIDPGLPNYNQKDFFREETMSYIAN